MYPDLHVPKDAGFGKPSLRPLRPLEGKTKRGVQVDSVLHGAALEGDNTIIGLDVWGRRGDKNLRDNRDGRTRMQRNIAMPLLRPDVNEVKHTTRNLHRTNTHDSGVNVHDASQSRIQNGASVFGRNMTSIDRISGINVHDASQSAVRNGASVVGRQMTSIDALSGINVHDNSQSRVNNGASVLGRTLHAIDAPSGLNSLTTNLMRQGASIMGRNSVTVNKESGINVNDSSQSKINNGASVLGRNNVTIDKESGINALTTNLMRQGATIMGRNLHLVHTTSGINTHDAAQSSIENGASVFGRNLVTVENDKDLNPQTTADIKSVEEKLKNVTSYVESQNWNDPSNNNNHGLDSEPIAAIKSTVPYIEEHTPVVLKGGNQFQYQPLPVRGQNRHTRFTSITV